MTKIMADPIEELLEVIREQGRLQNILDTTGGTEDTLIEIIELRKRTSNLATKVSTLKEMLKDSRA